MRRRTEITIETERTLVFAAAAVDIAAPHDYAERRCDACGAAARAVALDAEAAALFRIRPEEILRWIRATGLHVAEAGGVLFICLNTSQPGRACAEAFRMNTARGNPFHA
jgi:branched-subunit amino acid ABC-type transport system permease component